MEDPLQPAQLGAGLIVGMLGLEWVMDNFKLLDFQNPRYWILYKLTSKRY